jgi:hypothetical protein
LKPILSSYLQAGHPVIVWNKGKASALKIWVNRTNDNNFALLSVNTKTNVTDSTPLPTEGSRALWKYKTIYHLADPLAYGAISLALQSAYRITQGVA